MTWLRFLFTALLTAALLYVLHTRIGPVPPLGAFLDPFGGFWQNAESATIEWPETLDLEGLDGQVKVAYDDRLVPHIFAESDEDLYFMQGYLEARHRLFQMDFMSRIAGGQLAEVIGERGLAIDRYTRRLGMRKAAEDAWAFVEQDPQSRKIMQAYTDGVNAYIQSLTPRHYPVEFKLLDYAPTNWTPVRSLVIMKLMAFNLSSYDRDVELTNAYLFFGAQDFHRLFDLFPYDLDPIIPDTNYAEMAVAQLDTAQPVFPDHLAHWNDFLRPQPHVGSNNWAVHGSRTASGYPMLANDPHLRLSLPAIWYEQQHVSPNVNAYGVSIPGLPMITLGYNSDIAWGFTNAGRDVKDWYRLTLSDDKKAYLFDSTYMDFDIRVEEIKVRGMGTIVDSVRYTHYGPVTFDSTFQQDSSRILLGLRWKAHDPSNELLAIYKLNRAHDYDSYKAAIAGYTNPAQNMLFADRNGDIALTQQGVFPLLWPKQGRFVGDGTDPAHQWQGFIPIAHNPQHRNPDRGFASSANQQAATESYPYYYCGSFEYYRNRRINEVLAADSVITIEDMIRLQNDNKHLIGEDALSVLFPLWDNTVIPDSLQDMLIELRSWDRIADPNSVGAVYFDAFWEAFKHLCLDELRQSEHPIAAPKDYHLIRFMASQDDHWLFNIDSTSTQEDLLALSLAAMARGQASIAKWQETHDKPLTWQYWKNTTLQHWLSTVSAFHIDQVPIGGDAHIVNANSSTHGGSWRFIAHLKPEGIEAYGIYAGGQSGNPGSPYYGQFVDKWAAGEHYELLMLDSPTVSHDRIIYHQTFE